MTEHIIATVNGVENVDLSNIKCPICGNKMEIHRYDPHEHEQNGHLSREYGIAGHVNVYREKSRKEDGFGLQCPYCKAELNVTQTVVKH